MKRLYALQIDIIGACNLTCPTCPQGNTEARMPKGMMHISLLTDILYKAEREWMLRFLRFGFGRWPDVKRCIVDTMRQTNK